MSEIRWRIFIEAGFVGLFLTILQLALFLCAAPGETLGSRYAAGIQWDVNLYADVAEHGYVSEIPPTADNFKSNVSRFPGFSMLTWLVAKTTGLTSPLAALLASQIAAVLFWAYAFLLLRYWRVQRNTLVLALTGMVVFPFSFFLITGYSESLFMAALLGSVFWSIAGRGPWLAVCHGFVLGGTRITGMVLGACPAMATALKRKMPSVRSLALAASAILVTLLFLAYCQVRFGFWNLYFQTQEIGWGSRMNIWALFDPHAYSFAVPHWFIYPSVGLFLRSYLLPAILIGFVLEWRKGMDPGRVSLLLVAAVTYYLTFAGQYYANFQPIARHYLPVIYVLILFFCAIGARTQGSIGFTTLTRVAVWLFAAIMLVLSLGLQILFAGLYARGQMVF